MARLGDICAKASSNIAQKDLEGNQGPYPIYGASGLIKYVDFYSQEKPYVAVVKDGAGVGRAMELPEKSSVIGTMQYLIPAENTNVSYLAYVVEHLNLAKYYTGATIPHIYFKDYCNERVPDYSLSEQEAIAEVLNKICVLILLRKQQLAKLDELTKVRFVEMFGDPQQNPMKWKEVNISEVVSGKVSNGFFSKRDDYKENGNVSVMGVAYIVNRMYSQYVGLPKTDATDKDIEKYQVKYGDMLFCRSSLVAEGIGKASIIPENIPEGILFECHVIRLPLDLSKCVPEFMQVLSTTEYFRKQIVAQSKTATMTTIGQDGILKANIILPPLEKQKKFYHLVKHISKSKLTIQQSLDKLEMLRKSLMQQYFG